MAQTPEDKAKEDREAWDGTTSRGSEVSRWDAETHRTPRVEYRDKMGKQEQYEFLHNDLPHYFETEAGRQGKTQGDYILEKNKKVQTDTEQALVFDEVNFYKQVQEGMDHPPKGAWDRFTHWLWKEKLPRHIKKLDKQGTSPGRFREIMQDILRRRGFVEQIDADIYVARQNLTAYERELIAVGRNLPEEERIRGRIDQEQELIRSAITDRTRILEIGKLPDETKFNKIWTAVQTELKKENQKMKIKFGGRLSSKIQERQKYQSQLDKLNTRQHLQQKMQIQEKIDALDVELRKLRDEVIKYKSRRAIFLFEDLIGIESTDQVDRSMQASSTGTQRTWEEYNL